MTERLAELMRAEADALDVPPPPATDILLAGRSERRRRYVVPALGAAAAAVVVVALAVGPGSRLGADPGSDDGSVAVHERAGASFSDAEADAARAALSRGGAFAVGSTVYLGDRDYGVEIDDPAVRGLYYTSAGVLVRHGKDHAMDGSSRDTYSLIGTDGSITGLELHLGDVSPSTDPTQPYLAYAGPRDDGWDVLVLDLRTGELAARVPVDGAFTWGGWEAPPVALSGDRVYVGLDEAMVAVDWRTGEVTTTSLPGSTYPDVNADRYLQIRRDVSTDGAESDVTVRVLDGVSGETLLDLPSVGDRWASLSPDGQQVIVMPYLTMTEDGQIQRLDGAVLHTVATGERMALPPSPTGGYGWTPDGRVLLVSGDDLTVCDPGAGSCSTSPLGLGLTVEDAGTVRLGGVVNES